MAGLAAACTAARAGHEVVLHEATGAAGGRCRSFFDPTMQRVIDNGTHVLLGANKAALGFLDAIGAAGTMVPAIARDLPFVDLDGGNRWSVDVSGLATGALLKSATDFTSRAKLVLAGMKAWAGTDATVAYQFGTSAPAYDRLIAPLCTAAMNRPPEETPAAQFVWLIGKLAVAGRGALCPHVARENLGASLIHPALRAIKRHGGKIRFHDALTGIDISEQSVRRAEFRSGPVSLAPKDALVLAVPPWALEGISGASGVDRLWPYGTRAIICTHFSVGVFPERPGPARLTGCINAMAQWFAFSGGVLSVTVSAADPWLTLKTDEIAARLWRDAASALDMPQMPVPPHRAIKERRATVDFPGGIGPRCKIQKLFFAGGWTNEQYPDTIEAAVASGIAAANCLDSLDRGGSPLNNQRVERA